MVFLLKDKPEGGREREKFSHAKGLHNFVISYIKNNWNNFFQLFSMRALLE